MLDSLRPLVRRVGLDDFCFVSFNSVFEFVDQFFIWHGLFLFPFELVLRSVNRCLDLLEVDLWFRFDGRGDILILFIKSLIVLFKWVLTVCDRRFAS